MKKLAALLLAAVLALCAACALADAYPCGGTITTTSVNLRYGPSKSTRVVDKLTTGDYVTVLGDAVPIGDTWYYVRTQEGLTGYVHESLIDLDTAGYYTPVNTAQTSEAYRAIDVIERVLLSNGAIYDAQLMAATETGAYAGISCVEVMCLINGRYLGDFLITAVQDGIVLSGFSFGSADFSYNPYWIYDWNGFHQQSLENIPFEQWALQASGSTVSSSYKGNSLQGSVQQTSSKPGKPSGSGVYGLTIDKLSTRTGPGTSYEDAGTYSVKGQWLRVLSRAWSEANSIWWVKVEIPYRDEIRTLWTGYKRFDKSTLSLDDLPIEYW